MFNMLLNGMYLEALLFVIAAVLSIMLHEVAHGYMAIKNGDLTPKYAGRMNLNPVKHFDPIGFGLFLFVGFGWAKPVPVNSGNFTNYRKGLFQVSIAGVTVNFILAFFCYALMQIAGFIQDINLYKIISYFFYFMYHINIALCVFNLLPIYPLDGFRIVESQAKYGNAYVSFMYKYGFYVFAGFLLFINFVSSEFLTILINVIGFPIEFFWGLLGL